MSLESEEIACRVQETILVTKQTDWDRAWSLMKDTVTRTRVVGLDCEWMTAVAIENYERFLSDKLESEPRLSAADLSRVALLQLSTTDGVVAIIQLLHLHEGVLPLGVSENILENPRIVKSGVNIANDSLLLFKHWNICVVSAVDLRHLAVQVLPSHSKNKNTSENDTAAAPLTPSALGLKSLALIFFDEGVQKEIEVIRSCWAARHLDPSQVDYAAKDALLSAKLCTKLVQLIHTVPTLVAATPSPSFSLAENSCDSSTMCQSASEATWPTPSEDLESGSNNACSPLPMASSTSPANELSKLSLDGISQNEAASWNDDPWPSSAQNLATSPPTRLAELCWRLCEPYLDKPFKLKSNASSSKRLTDSPARNSSSPSFADLHPLAAEKYKQRYVRSSPLYHNVHLEAPDGTLLSMIDRSKAHWYIRKELGDLITGCLGGVTQRNQIEPANTPSDSVSPAKTVIRLRFEPKGRPFGTDMYYTKQKVNRCVVCGSKDGYQRKNIVPHQYRRHFPPAMKEHRSHDVVLLCCACHYRACQNDQVLIKKLEKDCSAPLCIQRWDDDPERRQLRSAAKALLHHAKERNLPADRVMHLESVLRTAMGFELTHSLGQECLEALLDEDAVNRSPNPNYIPHCEKVVEHMRHAEGGLVCFERSWRHHFVEHMSPKYLPAMWSYDHNWERYVEDPNL